MGDVRYLLDEDAATTNRLVDWHANPGAHRHVDPDLEAGDILWVAQEGNPAETSLIVRRGDGDVVWLEQGTDSYGKQHLVKRHITGELDHGDADMFPVGETVTRGEDVYDIPDRMTRAEVDDLIFDGVKHGSRDTSDPARIVYNPPETEFGIDEMRIIADQDSSIVTAYPTEGDAVITVPADTSTAP